MFHTISLINRNIDPPKIKRIESKNKARFMYRVICIPTLKNRQDRKLPRLKIYVLITRGYKPSVFKTIFKVPDGIRYHTFFMTDHDSLSMLCNLIERPVLSSSKPKTCC